MNQLGEKACDKTDDGDPKDAHGVLLSSGVLAVEIGRNLAGKIVCRANEESWLTLAQAA